VIDDSNLGIITDLINGLIAVIGVVIGRIVGDTIAAAIYFKLLAIILAIIGLVVAGAGLKRRGIEGALITGIGLGLATPIVALI
jgi:hypothetical protein